MTTVILDSNSAGTLARTRSSSCFEGDCAIAVELQFLEPPRIVRQLLRLQQQHCGMDRAFSINRVRCLLAKVAEQILLDLRRADFPDTTIDEEVMNIDEGHENPGTKR